MAQENTTSLAGFVDQLFHNVFFQSDDAVAVQSYLDNVAPDFTARVNTTKFSREQFLEAIKAARGAETFELQTSQEIVTFDAKDASGAGSVTQLGHFTSTNKTTGKVTKTTSGTIAAIGIVDGKRVLLELAETSKSEE